MTGTLLSEATSNSAHAPGRRTIDDSKIAYQLPQPAGMVADAFVGAAIMLDGDERDWVPQSPTVSFKPLLLNVTQGYYINILRVRASGVLSCHRHNGPVHAFTLRGTCQPRGGCSALSARERSHVRLVARARG